MATSESERIAALEKLLGAARAENQILSERNMVLQSALIRGTTRAAAQSEGVRAEALDDVCLRATKVFEIAADGVVVTKGNVGCTPGATPEQWLQEIRPKTSHWFGEVENSGNKGSTAFANNPWTAQHWNMTRQSIIFRDFGEAKAREMAAAAGVDVFAFKPAKKA